MFTTPVTASEPYTAEAPSATISILSTKDIGIRLRFTVPPPPKEAEPTVRRPLIRTAVRDAPAPRRLMVALD